MTINQYVFRGTVLKALPGAKGYVHVQGDPFVVVRYDCDHVGWHPAGVLNGPSLCPECSTVKADITEYHDFAAI